MSGLFGGPKVPSPLPVVNPADTANRLNSALARRLQAGGTNADNVSAETAPTAGARLPTLTGLN
ncbi:hypothetical protein [Phenylobacterium sp.]|uniref:hypothetical protein n=1 Tax=Phenylobacterium sp. TaxID=1871053 RepID=UPI002DF519BD|nr:hypothetical protein [Phenylobacterium sp.]